MENNELTIFKETVIYDENNDINVSFLCNLFEINYKNQKRFINNDHILSLSGTKKYQVGPNGKKRRMTSLSKEGFLRWIMILNPNIITESKRDLFKTYQKNLVEYLYGDKSIIANTKTKYELKVKVKEIDKTIHNLMIERQEKITEIKRLDDFDHRQLELNTIYDKDGKPKFAEPSFHKSAEIKESVIQN